MLHYKILRKEKAKPNIKLFYMSKRDRSLSGIGEMSEMPETSFAV